ncbi:MAG: hypothetical protein M0R80_08415 [Proteobacteria bacterium]|jgi:hypothetical protein|nr:hypothetical protein [Pseudomonadota bacterium]
MAPKWTDFFKLLLLDHPRLYRFIFRSEPEEGFIQGGEIPLSNDLPDLKKKLEERWKPLGVCDLCGKKGEPLWNIDISYPNFNFDICEDCDKNHQKEFWEMVGRAVDAHWRHYIEMGYPVPDRIREKYGKVNRKCL